MKIYLNFILFIFCLALTQFQEKKKRFEISNFVQFFPNILNQPYIFFEFFFDFFQIIISFHISFNGQTLIVFEVKFHQKVGFGVLEELKFTTVFVKSEQRTNIFDMNKIFL